MPLTLLIIFKLTLKFSIIFYKTKDFKFFLIIVHIVRLHFYFHQNPYRKIFLKHR